MAPKSTLSVLLYFSFFANICAQAGEDLIERADFLMQNSRFEDALLMLDQALKKNPQLYEARFKKAICYTNKGNFKQAINELEKAVLVKKDYYQAYEMLGNLYYQVRDAQKAVESYESAYIYDENIENRLTYKLEIIELLNILNKYVQTKKHIDDARQIVPDLFDLLFAEAKYYNEVEQYDKALELFDKIIDDVEPVQGNEKYFFEYGLALHHTGSYEKAAEAFKKADDGEFRLKIKQFSPDFYFGLADAYYQVFAYDLCEKYLNILIKLGPNNTKAYELQKKLTNAKADKSKAILIQEKIIKNEKSPSVLEDSYYDLAVLWYQNQEYEFAITASNNSLEVNPLNLNVIFIKAMSEYKLMKAEEATEVLSRAVRSPKMNTQTKTKFNFALGLIYENANRYQDAVEAYKSALNGSFKNAAGYELNHLFRVMQMKEIEK